MNIRVIKERGYLMLNINELKLYNQAYDADFNKGIKEADLEIVNNLLEKLGQLSRSTPQVGDIVILVCSGRRIKCHIESLNTGRGNLCLNCTYSHISNWSDSGYYCMTSGGHWTDAEPEEFKYIGITTRWFWTWGRHGVGPSNGICFPAMVSMWEVEINDAYLSNCM